MGCDLLWNTLTYALYSCAINTPFSTLPGKCQFIQVQPSILVLCENEYENSTTLPFTSTQLPTTKVPLTTTVAPTSIAATTTRSSTTSTTFHPTTTAFPTTTASVTTLEPTTLPLTTTLEPTTLPLTTTLEPTTLPLTTTVPPTTKAAETTLPLTTLPVTTTTVSTNEAWKTSPPTTTSIVEATTTTVRPTIPVVATSTIKPTPTPSTTTLAINVSGMIVKKEYVVKERVEKKDDTALVLSIVFGSILFLVLSSLLVWKRKELIGMCRDKCKCCKKENLSKKAEVTVEMTEREEIEKDLQNNRKTMINVQKALRRSKMKINSVGVSQNPNPPFSKSVQKPPIPHRSFKKGAIKGKNVREAVAALERQKK